MNATNKVTALARVNHAEQVAVGLERIAAQIRSGELPVETRRAVVVMAGADGHGRDNVAATFLGAEANAFEGVGMIELAKQKILGAL